MINLPNKFSHTGKYENVINRIIDYCRSITPVGSPTVKVSGSNHGMVLTAAAQSGSQSVPSTPGTVQYYNFVRSFKNYVLCSCVAGIRFRIAKDYKLRNLIGSETIYGTLVQYGYPHNVSGTDILYGLYRTANVSGLLENQGVVPQYLVGDPVCCIAATGGATGAVIEALDVSLFPSDGIATGQNVTLQEVGARAWARFANQSF